MITGGCHCGTCRYQVALDYLDDIAHCHCSICRRTSGGTLVTWATVPTAAFSWLGAEPSVYRATPLARRYFCSHCGTQLALEHDSFPGTLDITVTSLDQPEQFPPDRHIWVAHRLPWLRLDGQLPSYVDEGRHSSG